MKLVAKNGVVVVDNLDDLAKYVNNYQPVNKKTKTNS